MKKIINIICCMAVCVCAVLVTTATAHAETVIGVLNKEPTINERFYWKCANEYTDRNGNALKQWVDMSCEINSTNINTCLYVYNGIIYVQKADGVPATSVYYEDYTNGTSWESDGNSPFNVIPYPYCNTNGFTNYKNLSFETNIPIFEDMETAYQYTLGNVGIEKALNYGKTLDNGAWVKPFENIEINDSDILVPQLTNVSHNGFTVTNCYDEKYLVEIYMESGMQEPSELINVTNSIDNSLFVNAYGLITDNSEAYYNGPTFDIAQMYGIDNMNALKQSFYEFYNLYPSGNDYNSKIDDNLLYAIWGKPFSKNLVFYKGSSKVTFEELAMVTPNDIPLCYTQYKVRYFYYDDASGYHYGPWAVTTYFGSGYVTNSSIFQSNTGDVIETITIGGRQDSDGSISYIDDTNIVDLNNPNELFGYIRSVVNNVNASTNSFTTLFGSVFSFLPSEILSIIFLGIAVMVLVGVVKLFT